MNVNGREAGKKEGEAPKETWRGLLAAARPPARMPPTVRRSVIGRCLSAAAKYDVALLIPSRYEDSLAMAYTCTDRDREGRAREMCVQNPQCTIDINLF